MPYLELSDGVPLFYEESGSGPAVILIHGWTMNSSFWQGNVPALAEAGNRVIAVDLRGHGNSGKTPDGHTLAQYARDIRELASALGLTDVSLVGWSMGAGVILSYVEQFGTDNVRSVAFVDQSPRFLSAPGWDFPLFGNYTNLDNNVFAETVRYDRPSVIKPFIASCFATRPDDAAIDAAYAETTKTPTDAALDVWMNMVHQDYRDVVGKVTVPTMLAYGEKSAVFPGDVAGWLAERLPDAQVVPFPDSGHVPFAEEAERFNTELARFLAKH
ncbi:MAG: alpha/beta hydrolase [Corynebacteriales bacterium]|nr:alpha/beta hydrolase [Mycobacteriales bacterium]